MGIHHSLGYNERCGWHWPKGVRILHCLLFYIRAINRIYLIGAERQWGIRAVGVGWVEIGTEGPPTLECLIVIVRQVESVSNNENFHVKLSPLNIANITIL